MGEVRVKVKLTNAVDRALARAGHLPEDKVREYEAQAVADSGAVRCVLPQFVVDRLGLDIDGQRVAVYADGREDTVPVTSAFYMDVMGREEIESALVLGDEVLIGQTALERMDLLVDCPGRRLVPNPDHPDQPLSKIR